MEKIIMTKNDYRQLIRIARHVNACTDDLCEKEQKKKFLMRSVVPTPEELERHNVAANLALWLPYLVYYLIPGICPVSDDDPVLKNTRAYILNLFKQRITLAD